MAGAEEAAEGAVGEGVVGVCLHEEEHGEDVTGIGSFIVTSLAIGILVSIAMRKIKWLKLPFTLLVFIMGMLLGILNELVDLGQLGYSIDYWRALNPEILLFMFLPPLLFASAFSVEFHIFKRLMWQAIILATVGVLISAFLTGGVAIALFGYNWGWTEGLLFGSMFAATDPVAVVALLHELGAPETMSVMIEGESLLNDGVGFVLFMLFFEQLSGEETYTTGEIILKVAVESFGGMAVGVGLGLLGLFAMQAAWDDSTLAVTITVVIVWATFFLCELFEISGVIGVVCLGLVWAAFSNGYVQADVNEDMHHFWHKIEYMANTLVFSYSGVIVIDTLLDVDKRYTVTSQDVVNLILLFVGLNVIRFIAVGALYIPLKKTGYGITWQRAIIVSYGGLRGAVGLIAALLILDECTCGNGLLPTEETPCVFPETQGRMMFHMAGIVLLTLAVNGTTTKYIVNYLKLNKDNQSAKQVYEKAAERIHEHLTTTVESLKRHPHYRNADWEVVWSHLPILSHKVLEERKKMGNVGRASMVIRGNIEKISKERFVSVRINNNAPGMMSGNSNMEGVEDARYRFLNFVKASYRKQFKQGACGSWPAMQSLIEAANRCQDTPEKPLNEWDGSILKAITVPNWYARFCGPKGDEQFFHQISKSYDMAATFLRTHKNVVPLFKHATSDTSKSVVNVVLAENAQMVKAASDYVEDVEVNYPDIARSVKTNITVQRLLKDTEKHAEEMCENAEIEEKDLHTIVHELEHSRQEIKAHRKKVHHIQSPAELVRNHTMFTDVSKNIVSSVTARCSPKTFEQGAVMVQQGSQMNCLYMIIRGKVNIQFATGKSFYRMVGDSIGTVEFVMNRPSIATVTCQTRVEVAVVPLDVLSEAMRSNKTFERNLLREAGFISLEYHFPQLQFASFDLLKKVLPHIRVIGPHRSGEPVQFKSGIGLGLKGRIQYVGGRRRGEVIPLMTPFHPEGAVRFDPDARLMFVKNEAVKLIKQYTYYGQNPEDRYSQASGGSDRTVVTASGDYSNPASSVMYPASPAGSEYSMGSGSTGSGYTGTSGSNRNMRQ